MASGGASLGRAIREARVRLGMTQAQLARALEVQQNVVARLEEGGRPDPRLSTVVAVSEVLGIPIDELVARAGLTAKRAAPAALEARYARAAHAARTAREQLSALDAALAELIPEAGPGPGHTKSAERRRRKG